MQSQFNHKQPTRFNAPEIPQDLATKGYVDSLTPPDRWLNGNRTSRNLDNDDGLFWSHFNSANPTAAEGPHQVPFSHDATIQRWTINVSGFTSANPTTLTSRIDNVDTLLILTFSAAGQFSVDEDVDIDQGELLAMRVNHVDDTGTTTVRGIMLNGIFR